MELVIKQTAAEIAPELNRCIDGLLDGLRFNDPAPRKALETFLWDNKVGILRVLQAVANEN